MRRKIKLLFFTLALAVVLPSCNNDVIYTEHQTFENNTWSYDDVKTFSFEMEEDTTPVKIFINLRTTVDYPYSNIYMYMHSDFPNGYHDIDTLEFFLARPEGEWLGEVNGTIVENHAIITQGYLLDKGTYTFKLEQAMYEDSLPELLDVGLTVKYFDVSELQKEE
ncbi:MAG: gliding motility lipoprotein GldH [Putridiphycobacter sp.]